MRPMTTLHPRGAQAGRPGGETTARGGVHHPLRVSPTRGTIRARSAPKRRALRCELTPASSPPPGSVLLLVHLQQGRGLGADADKLLIGRLVLLHPSDGLVVPGQRLRLVAEPPIGH